ncbi:MAG: VWA domain-containing protein, partial [Lachnospiraceae bacterium]
VPLSEEVPLLEVVPSSEEAHLLDEMPLPEETPSPETVEASQMTQLPDRVQVQYKSGDGLDFGVKEYFYNEKNQVQISLEVSRTDYEYNRAIVTDAKGTVLNEGYQIEHSYDKKSIMFTKTESTLEQLTIQLLYTRILGESDIVTSKTATVIDDKERMYQLDLQASASPTSASVSTPVNVTLLLDISGSMIYTDAKVASSIEELDKLDKNKIYFTNAISQYGQGLKLNAGLKGKLNPKMKSKDVYMGAPIRGKVVFYQEGKWYYTKIKNGTATDVQKKEITASSWTSEIQKLYTQRSEALISSAQQFVGELNEGSMVSVIVFGDRSSDSVKGATVRQDWIALDANNKEAVQTNIETAFGVYNTSTYIQNGLTLVENQLDNIMGQNEYGAYTVVFNDGNYDGSISQNSVHKIKETSTVYTIGIYVTDWGKIFLEDLASDQEHYYDCTDMEEVAIALAEISHSFGGTVSGASITDYIDSRFILVKQDGSPYLDGEVVSGGILHIKADGTQYVEWTDETIGTKEENKWKATIWIKAKNDFLGGNQIPTNGKDSAVTVEEKLYPFPRPTVHVPVQKLQLENQEKLLFLGEKGTSTKDLCQTLLNTLQPKELQLSIEEQQVLLLEGTYVRGYQYGTTGDELGTVTYTWEQTKNIAKEQQYKLLVTYLPTPARERPHTGVEPVGMETTEAECAMGISRVHVVSGELQIDKTIDQPYTKEPIILANQSYVFRIERREEKEGPVLEQFYEVIDFFANEQTFTKSKVIKGLKQGYYTIHEESDWSWKYVEQVQKRADNYPNNHREHVLLPIGEPNVKSGFYGVQTGTNVQGVCENPATVSFVNEKRDTKVLGDVANVINQFTN